MKFRKILTLLLILPLTGCTKKPLVIPSVDVDSITINLPDRPTRNSGAIRSSDGFDYIDLYELSDFHGAVNFEPNHESGTYIGLSKLSSFFEKKRQSNPGGTLLLSSGDMFQGSAESNLTRGYMVNYSMQYMGFDAMAIGNHEFDWTDEWLKKNAELKYNTSTIPYLGANILKNDALPDYLQKSTVVTRGDYKIGVIGVIGSELENTILKSAIEGYNFVEYSQIVSDEAARLRNEEHCNAVVLLAHSAADLIETSAAASVDAIFGGHAHADVNFAGFAVPSVATLNYGQSVAHIALKFNSNTKQIVSEGTTSEIIKMSSYTSLDDDANINKIMSQYGSAIDKIKNIKLGKCNDTLAHDGALINICTVAMHEAAVESVKANPAAGIDASKIVASYHNINGGVRDDIAKGKITYGSVYKAFPFDNEVVLVKLTGKEFLACANSLNKIGLYKTISDRSEIDRNADYYIVLTDFLAFSKYCDDVRINYEKIKDENLIRTGKIVRDEVAKKIYSINNVKNAKWAAEEDCHSRV